MMAPNGHAPVDSLPVDHQSRISSRSDWHVRHGSGEFKIWQKENPSEHISYDEWKTSQHAKGLSLYYATLHVWDESDSSEQEVELPKIEASFRTMRGPSAREPKKTLKANSNGLSRSVVSATPSATPQSEDFSPSSKKRRKSRKKYLSQEIVASDDNEVVEAATPPAPVVTINGRRKSSTRKPKKKPLSEETIAPEDEEDDQTAMHGIITSAMASPLPVRPAPNAAATGKDPYPHKKTILKLSTRKQPKKKFLSEETVHDDDADIGDNRAATLSANTATATAPLDTPTTGSRGTSNANVNVTSYDATASPHPKSESAAAIRRGLRARRPAQQRPYSLDAETYENSEVDDIDDEEGVVQETPNTQSRRMSIDSLRKEPLGQLDDETLAILQGSVDRKTEEEQDTYGRTKHFKGKGRAWKKEGSDEDLEFNPGKKRSTKAKAKTKAAATAAQQPKKRGRIRKSHLSEDMVRGDSDDEAFAVAENANVSPAARESATKKTRKPSRKSILSEEIVRDDTDEEESDSAQALVDGLKVPTEVSTPVSKQRGRPRKSDQNEGSMTVVVENKEAPEDVAYKPNGTVDEFFVSKDEVKQASPFLEEGAAPTTKNIEEESAVATPATRIEDFMASVNAEDSYEDEKL